jgi:glc operon protein GlcG
MDTRSRSGARLVAFARRDTAPLGKALQDLIGQGGANLRLLAAPGVTPLEGGVPIVADGKIIGAIGVSGAMSDQDAQCAMAGAAAATAK